MFESILTGMTDALCDYGIWSAAIPSCHGGFEPPIPEALIKMREQ